jgi:LuxR family transcriptional regulator, maltose regulon positive regulatory protein
MALKDLVIRSQLIPPRQRRGVLRRPRLEARLLSVLDHPLTLVHAGTGYGKSTALCALASVVDPLAWYTITEPDRDPLLFLAHLICAFEGCLPAGCDAALGILEESTGRVVPAALTPLLNALVELDRDAVLVLDDYHLVGDLPEIAALVERLVDYMPPRLHVVLSCRHLPHLAHLARWRAKGQVLSIGRAELVFSGDEVEALFRNVYGWPLSREQAEALAAETEGWVIALQMVWQNLQSDMAPGLDAMLGRLPSTLETLFDYLAQDVLARQPPAHQRFLLTTSVLREMQGTTCDHLLEVEGSGAILRRLYEDGLFVVAVGEGIYRYQHLFHDFLRSRLRGQPDGWRRLHRRAAEHFRQAGHREESVYHLLEAEDYGAAAGLLEEIGPGLVALGRFDSLISWIGRLPPEVQAAHPALDLLLGDVLRLRAHFDEALGRYQAAEARYVAATDRVGLSLALKGQAQVYVDTVRPLKAESLLEDALRLLEPMEHRGETAALLDLLAENKLNLGSPDEAQKLHHEARLLRSLRSEADPGDVYLEARAMLRTGRLAEARRLLERRAEEEGQADASRPQRFHRETLLLLALICALQGDATATERCAREGIAVGRRLQSSFVEAVGMMRLGHALQLREVAPWQGGLPAGRAAQSGETPRLVSARECYEGAIERVRDFNVMRTHVEPLWGLCRLHGHAGDLVAARRCADEALEIGGRAGDEWICDLVRATMGAGYATHHVPEEARAWLTRAAEGFEHVGDDLSQAAARLWLALDAWWRGEPEGALAVMARLLPQVQAGGWDEILVQRTFLGLWSDQAALPLLVEAWRQGIEPTYTGRLLRSLGLADAEAHPGYGLWVRTLGPFAVWRDDVPVSDGEWRREKARRLFQLLLTQRGQWLYREQLVEQLWPDLAPEAASRDFRVALNALNHALEAGRSRAVPPFFAMRRGTQYGLNPAARIRLDADEFQRLAACDDEESLRLALALYQDDYLPDCLYEDWPAAERQRLRDLYLSTAERLARRALRARAWDEVVSLCEAILARDDCWEAAYRLLMRAHAAAGNRALVQSTYQRCLAALGDGLGIEPSATTRALLDKLS